MVNNDEDCDYYKNVDSINHSLSTIDEILEDESDPEFHKTLKDIFDQKETK